jgi:Flp pilus assembly protein TadB
LKNPVRQVGLNRALSHEKSPTMPLPTRRAIRPDSRHHRQARRQRLSRSGRGHRVRRFWGLLGAMSLIVLIVSVLFATLSSQHHGWVMPMLYISIACVVVSILAMLFMS